MYNFSSNQFLIFPSKIWDRIERILNLIGPVRNDLKLINGLNFIKF